MKTGMESSSVTSMIVDSCLYPFRKISAGFWHILGDSGKIIRQQDQFILNELTDRAINSNEGYAATYLGLLFLRAASFFVFTGEDYVKSAAEYGEYDENRPEKFDPQARSLFEPVKEFLGDPSIINMNGPGVINERIGIKNNLTISRAAQATWDTFDKLLPNWSNEKSLNHMICFICTQIIADAWFNIKDIPEELIPLLKKAEYYVFNRNKVSNDDFEKLRIQIKKLNDKVIAEKEGQITSGPSYLTYLKENRQKNSLTELNALAALVVEGNITTVLTGAILELANNIPLQNRLREELQSLDETNLRSIEGFQKIRNLPFLKQLYLESLRYYSPAPPLVRYASRAGNVNGVAVPARSYLFIPLRQIMHNPKIWPNPDQFNPSRFDTHDRRINQYPLTPFSTGRRVCPASHGFAEVMFKITLVNLFKDHQLTLTSHHSIEKIPVSIKEPRFKQTYFGKLSHNVSENHSSNLSAFGLQGPTSELRFRTFDFEHPECEDVLSSETQNRQRLTS